MKLEEEIIKKRDCNRLMGLDEKETESVLIKLLYDYLYKKPVETMNSNQRDLFLLMTLEDHCQADGLDSLSDDEELFFLMPDTYKALLRINAPKTAEALKEFIDMLPEGCLKEREIPDWEEWFMDEQNSEKIAEIDGIISSYPDGLMRTLYTSFIKDNVDFAKDILDV